MAREAKPQKGASMTAGLVVGPDTDTGILERYELARFLYVQKERERGQEDQEPRAGSREGQAAPVSVVPIRHA